MHSSAVVPSADSKNSVLEEELQQHVLHPGMVVVGHASGKVWFVSFEDTIATVITVCDARRRHGKGRANRIINPKKLAALGGMDSIAITPSINQRKQ